MREGNSITAAREVPRSRKGPSPHHCLLYCRQTNCITPRPNSGRGVISLPKNICLLIAMHYQLKQFHNEAIRPNEVDVIIG